MSCSICAGLEAGFDHSDAGIDTPVVIPLKITNGEKEEEEEEEIASL